MDLNRLAVFLKIVEEHSVSSAAKKLGVPKSSVSRSLKLLEQELGTELLRRTTRKLVLTDAGQRLFTESSRALSSIAEVEAQIADDDTAVRGPVRITAPVDAGVWLLASMIAEFSKLYPNVRVELSLSARVIDLVSEGYDLAVRAGVIRDTSLVARAIRPIPMILLASQNYLQKHGTPKCPQDLAQHQCVLFREFGGRAIWRLEGPNGLEPTAVTGAIIADDFSFLRALATQGAGIALLPSFVLSAKDPTLVRVLPKYSVQSAPLHLVYPPNKYVPRRVVILRDFLLSKLGGKPIARKT
jgi:DNA-binding transcriptional LysR family regulator